MEDLQKRLEEFTLKEAVGNLGAERASMGSTGSGTSITGSNRLNERMSICVRLSVRPFVLHAILVFEG